MAKVFTQRFNSWGEFVNFAETCKASLPQEERRSRSGSNFNGGTFEENVQRGRYGWPEGAKKVEVASSKLLAEISSRLVRLNPTFSDEAKGQLDVAKFLENEPECWLTQEPVIIKGGSQNYVTIVANVSVSCGIDQEILETKGIAIATLVQALEISGTRTKVIMAGCTASDRNGAHDRSKGGYISEVFVTLKDFNQPLDSGILAFALAHPGSNRCLLFSWFESVPAEFASRIIPYSYGSPCEVEDQGDIYFGKMFMGDPRFASAQGAEKYVMDVLKERNVELIKL